MKKSLLLIGASFRSLLRWAREHIYSWLILAPVVLGITYFTAVRVAENLPEFQPSAEVIVIFLTVFNLGLIGFSLSRASAEIYHHRRPESYFDSLPLSPATHLHAALAVRVTRTMLVALSALILRTAFLGVDSLRLIDFPALICFIAIVALSEAFAALNWIHWGHTRNIVTAFWASVVTLVNAAQAAALLIVAINATSVSLTMKLRLIMLSVGLIFFTYCLVLLLNAKWRQSDIEYARRLQLKARSPISLELALERKLSRMVAAQLARDLRLTLRAFSSAVFVVYAVAALIILALIAALTTDLLPSAALPTAFLDTTWLPQVIAIKVSCVLALVTLAALLPILIAFELPHMWLERAVGTSGIDLLNSKIWYARLITMPAPVLVWIVGLLLGASPLFYSLPLLAECLWLWWLLSTLSGLLSFEMPTRPDLAIIVTGTLCLALGLASAMLWPVGLIVYPQAMHSLGARGRHRARYYLITEAE
ncbi:MAG TPA: hypothetical protein VKN18_25920 [Blastocatellia bacterium]|nr:hypothetical protein [Blastocatellia bacterium]